MGKSILGSSLIHFGYISRANRVGDANMHQASNSKPTRSGAELLPNPVNITTFPEPFFNPSHSTISLPLSFQLPPDNGNAHLTALWSFTAIVALRILSPSPHAVVNT